MNDVLRREKAEPKENTVRALILRAYSPILVTTSAYYYHLLALKFDKATFRRCFRFIFCSSKAVNSHAQERFRRKLVATKVPYYIDNPLFTFTRWLLFLTPVYITKLNQYFRDTVAASENNVLEQQHRFTSAENHRELVHTDRLAIAH